MLLSENSSAEERNAFLSKRIQLIEHLILTHDIKGLTQVLQNDRDNIACLQSELRKTGESISNINKVQLYANCAE